MNTLYLTPQWDLTLDSSGSIAMASNPYALAQDAASAIKTFSGECYYDTTQGIPYFSEILGELPPVSLLKSQFQTAALTVPEVTAATVVITGIVGRQIQGQVQISDKTGATQAIGF